jgi:hypothetical protein
MSPGTYIDIIIVLFVHPWQVELTIVRLANKALSLNFALLLVNRDADKDIRVNLHHSKDVFGPDGRLAIQT